MISREDRQVVSAVRPSSRDRGETETIAPFVAPGTGNPPIEKKRKTAQRVATRHRRASDFLLTPGSDTGIRHCVGNHPPRLRAVPEAAPFCKIARASASSLPRRPKKRRRLGKSLSIEWRLLIIEQILPLHGVVKNHSPSPLCWFETPTLS